MSETPIQPVQPPTRIFVTCEDETVNDEMDDNMENLCKAVTEQALD